jgi:hypothetical protein
MWLNHSSAVSFFTCILGVSNPPDAPLGELSESYTGVKLDYFGSSSLTITMLNSSSLTFVLKEHLQEMTDVREHGPQSPSWQSFSQVWMKSVIKRDRVGSDNCTD